MAIIKVTTTSQRLKEIMQERNLRQVDIIKLCQPFCQKLNIRIGSNDISQYVSGKVTPNQDKILVLAKALNVPETWLMGYNVPITEKSHKKRFKIKVLGSVGAGIPIEMIDDVIDYEELDQDEFPYPEYEYFGLKISGHSMEPRICDGDTVIVHQQPTAESGEIVIVSIGNENAVCKKIKINSNGITLISFNPVFEPMVFTRKEIISDPVNILGKVVELRGKL